MIQFSKTLFMDDGDLALVSYDSFKMEIKIYLGKKTPYLFSRSSTRTSGEVWLH